MNNIRLVRALPEANWQRFLAENPNSNIFQTPEMFEVFKMAKRHDPSFWAVVDNAGQPLALFLPVQMNVLGGPLRQLTTRSVAYGSVLYETTDDGKEALAFLLRSYTRAVGRKPLFTELRNLTDLEDVQPALREHGFIYEDHLNYLIDISLPVESIFQNIKKHTRRNIQRALNQGEVVIKEVETSTEIAICYDLLHRTYRSARVPLADYTLFDAAFHVLYPKGMIRFVLAYLAGFPLQRQLN